MPRLTIFALIAAGWTFAVGFALVVTVAPDMVIAAE